VAVYDGWDVYGPYVRADKRQHVVLVLHDENGSIVKRRTISYPKYLVEKYLDRYLNSEETVDHIDGDFSNNSLENLRVVLRSLHAKSHASKRQTVQVQCLICGKTFVTNNINRVCCGDKHCVGKLSHVNGYNLGYEFVKKSNILLPPNRSLIEEIQSVEGANSGKSLVDNPEQ